MSTLYTDDYCHEETTAHSQQMKNSGAQQHTKKQQQQKDTNNNKKDDEKLTVVTYTGQYIIAECQSKNWNVRCVSSDMTSECHSEQRVVGLTHWRNHKVDTTGENVCQLETRVEASASNDTPK